jgi:hypothetical protein
MKAQIKKGGKIFTGKLASIFVSKGIAKEVRAKRTEKQSEPKGQSEPIKKVNKPVKKTVKKK